MNNTPRSKPWWAWPLIYCGTVAVLVLTDVAWYLAMPMIFAVSIAFEAWDRYTQKRCANADRADQPGGP
ncbi:hypothetical protein C6N75_15880 [Streptomyces solincola]|uniref:Uncharacterized protein n=1 Tax=Streptomyces solincola TaxID=2100817 RepID=A0A2S9PVA1_9ACTN|nr:hypothetical protein C6N75_15880 [Streptomyces solincola]